jgi:hypothetical protein
MIVSRMFQLTALQTGPARMPKSYTGETVTEIHRNNPAVPGQNVSFSLKDVRRQSACNVLRRSLRRNAHESV